MSGAIFIILFFAMAGWGFFTGWYSARLFRAFCVRFPSMAEQESLYVSSNGERFPKNGLFFLRGRVADVLRADPIFSRQRSRLMIFMAIMFLSPFAFSVSLVAVLLLGAHQ